MVILDMMVEARLDEREKLLNELEEWLSEAQCYTVRVQDVERKLESMRRSNDN